MALLPQAGSGGGYDIYAYERLTGNLSLVSQGADRFAASYAQNPSISGDGALVTYDSLADNIVPNDNNGLRDIFVGASACSCCQ
jgi:hypothetical protein